MNLMGILDQVLEEQSRMYGETPRRKARAIATPKPMVSVAPKAPPTPKAASPAAYQDRLDRLLHDTFQAELSSKVKHVHSNQEGTVSENQAQMTVTESDIDGLIAQTPSGRFSDVLLTNIGVEGRKLLFAKSLEVQREFGTVEVLESYAGNLSSVQIIGERGNG
jgi:hypothetical protein